MTILWNSYISFTLSDIENKNLSFNQNVFIHPHFSSIFKQLLLIIT